VADLYGWLKFLHVFLAILAVGTNLTYPIWLARAKEHPAGLGHVLRGIKFLDDRVANPAYALLLLTGFALVLVGGLDLLTGWILGGLGLYVLLVLVAIFGYSPALKRQIQAVDEQGPASSAYERASLLANAWGGSALLVALVIVALMVLKPSLGG
jgi:uncharacterized membrane protein